MFLSTIAASAGNIIWNGFLGVSRTAALHRVPVSVRYARRTVIMQSFTCGALKSPEHLGVQDDARRFASHLLRRRDVLQRTIPLRRVSNQTLYVLPVGEPLKTHVYRILISFVYCDVVYVVHVCARSSADQRGQKARLRFDASLCCSVLHARFKNNNRNRPCIIIAL